jgi:hypothetical protein
MAATAKLHEQDGSDFLRGAVSPGDVPSGRKMVEIQCECEKHRSLPVSQNASLIDPRNSLTIDNTLS